MKILGAIRTPILMPALLSILLRLITEIGLHLVPISLLSPIVVVVLPHIVIHSLKTYRQRNKLLGLSLLKGDRIDSTPINIWVPPIIHPLPPISHVQPQIEVTTSIM
jgi:hypothetical protein